MSDSTAPPLPQKTWQEVSTENTPGNPYKSEQENVRKPSWQTNNGYGEVIQWREMQKANMLGILRLIYSQIKTKFLFFFFKLCLHPSDWHKYKTLPQVSEAMRKCRKEEASRQGDRTWGQPWKTAIWNYLAKLHTRVLSTPSSLE